MGAKVFDFEWVRYASTASQILLVLCLRAGCMFKLLILNRLCMPPQFHQGKPQKIFGFWKVGGSNWYVTGEVGVSNGKALEYDTFWDTF
jgi:hypothetical protein